MLHLVQAAVDRIRQDAKGAATLAEWIGDGGVPVSPELANKRADICATCPQNVAKVKKIEKAVAEAILRKEEVRNKMDLRTGNDHNLRMCATCGCYLKLKVWVPKKHLSSEEFPSNCWFVKEEEEERIAAEELKKKKPDRIHISEGVIVRPGISIRRMDAYGDVIMASILASKMNGMGFDVKFACSHMARTPLYNHPHIYDFITDSSKCDVELDATYERSPERTSKDISLLMLEAAIPQIEAIGLKPPDVFNRVPTLRLTPDESDRISVAVENMPRPITVFVQKSSNWPNRAVNSDSIVNATLSIPGTKIWAYPSPCPIGFTPIKLKNFRDLMAIVSVADVIVTPDTGPLHVAAAFNRKVVYLETCNFSHLRLTNLTDYTTASAAVDCIGCGEFKCPKNETVPPCQEIDPSLISNAVLNRLGSSGNSKVSAIIPVHKYNQRLHRCIDAVRDQVDEIIVSIDGDAEVPNLGPKVRVVGAEYGTRQGYGKTCMKATRHAVGEFLLMLNDDCYMHPGAISAMKDAMKSGVAVVGSQLWYPDGTIQHGGTFRNAGDIGFGHLDHRKRIPSVTNVTQMEFVTFASALVRRSAFYDVRGFDEAYDCYSEDSDLCMKLREKGWKVMYQPAAIGIHDESQSTSPMKLELLKHGFKIFRSKWERYFRHNPPIK
jgi:GT2 family glycosyltransferase